MGSTREAIGARPRRQARAGGLAIFREVLESVVDERPLNETFDLIARRVSELARFDFCGILLFDPDHEHVHVAGAYRLPARYERMLDSIFRVPYADATLAGSPTSQALRQQRTVVLNDAASDPAYEQWRGLAEAYGFRSIVSVPLVTQGQSVGVLNGYSKRPREITKRELTAMEALAQQAALALRLTLLVETQHATIDELRCSNGQLEHQRSVLERAHEIHLRLTDAVIAGADFQSVSQILAELISRPTAVADAHGAVICASDPPPDPTVRARFDEWLSPTRRDRQANPSNPDARDEQYSEPLIVGRILVGLDLQGFVIAEAGDDDSRDLDLRAVEHAATVLAVHIAKERVARATEERLQSDFLFDLLNQRDTEDRLGRRAIHYGLHLGKTHRVLVLSVADWAEHERGAERVEDQLKQRRDRILRVAGDTVKQRLPGSLLSRIGNVVTAVVPTPRPADGLATIRSAIADCRRHIEQMAPGLMLSAGVGSRATHLADLAASYAEAQQCVDVLGRLGKPSETIAVDELGVLRLFVDTRRPDVLASFGREVLGPALDHDAKTGGALLSTLECYLDTSCSLRACADALFVHPNTVKYRLGRVGELCGLDLRNPDDLVKATIARLSLKLLTPLDADAAH
jgi:sugar diacid utilization regulator/putative methionine-R-sulfoxide reductase with GAF domain